MITNALVPTSGVDLLTALSGQNLAVVFIGLYNYGLSAVTADVYVLPNGSTVGNQSHIASRQLASTDSFFIDSLKVLLSGGDKITVVASLSDSLNATASYIQI